MVTVPKYERSARLNPLIQADFSVRSSPDDFGAAAARGLGDAAQGVSRLAQAKIAVAEMEGEAQAKEADNAYAAWAREAMYGENGYMNLEGQAAVVARADFEKQAAEKRQEFGTDLKGFGAKAYTSASEARLNSILDSTITHQASERKTWMKTASEDRAKTFADDALAAFDNPKAVEKNIAAGLAEIRSMGALAGLDADSMSLREAEFTSGVHKNVALRMAQTNPAAALDYAKSHESVLGGAAMTDLENILAPVIIERQARDEAERIAGSSRGPAVVEEKSDRVGPTITAAGKTDAAYKRAISTLSGKSEGGAARLDALVNLDKDFAVNMAALIEDAPPGIIEGLGLTSAYRSPERQKELFEASDGSGKMVARPGHSSHEFGLAVDLTWNGKKIKRGDVPDEVVDYLHNNAAAYGLNFRMSWEDWHIEPVDARQRIDGGSAPTVTARGTGVSVRASAPSVAEQQAALDAIENPLLRDETAKRLKLISDMRDNEVKAQQEALKLQAFGLVDQGGSPDNLDPTLRAQLGREEMAGLWSYYEARNKPGGVKTDYRALYDLQTQYANDPQYFASLDLFEYRSALSDSDWEKVNGWRQTALTDARKAGEDTSTIISSSDYMKTQLEAVGISATGKEGDERQEAVRREAEFQIALQREIDTFIKTSGGKPNPTDVQSMVNRMLLPVVVSTPGMIYGTNETSKRLFEVPQLGKLAGGATAAIYADISEIPQAERAQIEVALEQQLGYKPSDEQVEAEYARYLSATISTGP